MKVAEHQMAKVVFRKLNPKPSKSKKRVPTKRVRDANGVVTRVNVVDAASKSLPNDIRYVFSRNVSEARKANKQRLGSSDLVPPSA
jgi:hypothetical protein